MRNSCTILGVGLVVLWIAGLTTPNSAAWLTWLDGLGAICAFVIAGYSGVVEGPIGLASGMEPVSVQERGMLSAAGPFALATFLYVLWVAGLGTNGALYQNWWTFTFACGFAAIGIVEARRRIVLRDRKESEKIRDRDDFRKSA